MSCCDAFNGRLRSSKRNRGLYNQIIAEELESTWKYLNVPEATPVCRQSPIFSISVEKVSKTTRKKT